MGAIIHVKSEVREGNQLFLRVSDQEVLSSSVPQLCTFVIVTPTPTWVYVPKVNIKWCNQAFIWSVNSSTESMFQR